MSQLSHVAASCPPHAGPATTRDETIDDIGALERTQRSPALPSETPREGNSLILQAGRADATGPHGSYSQTTAEQGVTNGNMPVRGLVPPQEQLSLQIRRAVLLALSIAVPVSLVIGGLLTWFFLEFMG